MTLIIELIGDLQFLICIINPLGDVDLVDNHAPGNFCFVKYLTFFHHIFILLLVVCSLGFIIPLIKN